MTVGGGWKLWIPACAPQRGLRGMTGGGGLKRTPWQARGLNETGLVFWLIFGCGKFFWTNGFGYV